jgi:hypothetical protein
MTAMGGDADSSDRGRGKFASNLPIDGHSFRRVEVSTGTPRRRRWSAAEKAAIVAIGLSDERNRHAGQNGTWPNIPDAHSNIRNIEPVVTIGFVYVTSY